MAFGFRFGATVGCATVVALILSLAPGSALAARTISGTVRDARTLLPVPHAVVELRETGRITEADATGRFAFAPLPDGDYHLCVQRIGYRRQCDIEVHVGAEEYLAPLVLLEPKPLIGETVEVRGIRKGAPAVAEPSRIVISADEVRQTGGATVADVLERRGIEVVRQGSQAVVTIRGGRPEAVQVKVDGVSINAGGGAADLSTIPAASIESIEIVQGPSAVAAVVDALSGAVLIRTRPPDDRRKFSVGGAAGSFGLRNTSLQVDGIGHGSQRLRLGWYNDLQQGSFVYDDPQLGPDVERINNDAHRQNFIAQGAGTFTPAWGWGASLSYFRARAGVPGPEFQLTALAGRRQERYVGSAHVRRGDANGELELGYSFTHDWNHYENPGTLPYRSRNQSDLHNLRAGYARDRGFARGMSFSIEYIHERLEGADLLNPAYSFGTARRDHYAATTRYQRAVSLHASIFDELGMSLGARYDQTNTSGDYPRSPVSPPVESPSSVWRTVNPEAQVRLGGRRSKYAWSWFARYSSAFRRPPLLEQFWQEAYRTRGNPALLPERARQFETGYGIIGGGNLRVSWQQQFYVSRYRNLIYWRVGQGDVYTPANIGSASIDGRTDELRLGAWAGALELSMRHEFQDHRNTAGEPNTDGQPLPFRYRHKTQASIAGTSRGARVELTRRWYDRRYLREAATKSLDPYAVTDLIMGVQVIRGGVKGDLSFSVLNLGDVAYETIEREPMPGRSYHLNLKLEI